MPQFNILQNSSSKTEEFKKWCDLRPDLIRKSLLVFKTWILLGNKRPIPYFESTMEECLEWFESQ